MKTKSLFTVAVLMGAMTMGVFTSCSSSDDNGGIETNVPDYTPASASFTYKSTINPSLLEYVDVTVDYYDENGNVKTEKITEKEWTKKIATKLPVKVAVRQNLIKKEGIDYTKFDYITIETGLSVEGSILTKSGSAVGGIMLSDGSGHLSIPGDNFERFLTEKGTGYKKVFVQYDATGKKTDGNW